MHTILGECRVNGCCRLCVSAPLGSLNAGCVELLQNHMQDDVVPSKRAVRADGAGRFAFSGKIGA